MDIAAIYASVGVELHQRQEKWTGLCPFHPEQKPSFWVYPDGGFYCFGCQAYGTLEDLLGGMGGEYQLLKEPGNIKENKPVKLNLLKRKYEAQLSIELDAQPKETFFRAYDRLDRLFLFARAFEDTVSMLNTLLFLERGYNKILNFINSKKR